MLEEILGLGGVGHLDSTKGPNLDFERSSDTWGVGGGGSPALSQSERSQSRQPRTEQLTSQLTHSSGRKEREPRLTSKPSFPEKSLALFVLAPPSSSHGALQQLPSFGLKGQGSLRKACFPSFPSLLGAREQS